MPAKPTKITIAWDDGTSQDWVPAAAATPATPTPVPIPTPTPTPTPTPPPVIVVTDPQLPADAIKVAPGQSVQAAIDIAGPLGGKTIGLLRGAKYGGGLLIRRGNGLTITAYGDPAQPLPLLTSPADGNGFDVPKDAALQGLTLRGLAFRPPDRTPGAPGFRQAAKGDGINIMGRVDGLTLDGIDAAYYRQNIVIDTADPAAGCSDVQLLNLRLAYAWAVAAPDNPNQYLGQGLYLNAPRGPVKISGCAFVHNGWNEALPLHTRSQYRHNLYCQRTSAAPQITDSAFIDGASFGAQLRPGGTFDACYFQGNAFAAAGFTPSWAILRSAVLATGGRQWDGSGWIGNGGLYSWADSLTAIDTALVYLAQPAPAKAQSQYVAPIFGAALAQSACGAG